MLAALGFEALATTSAGFAFSLGRPDAEGAVNRQDTLTNVHAIVDATTLPVSADLENGFGDDPETCSTQLSRSVFSKADAQRISYSATKASSAKAGSTRNVRAPEQHVINKTPGMIR